MFSLFQPRCPLNAGEKAWVEYRVTWLVEFLGAERLRNFQAILPTGEFFPLPYHGEPEEVQAVFERVCGYMDLDPRRYRLNLFDERTGPNEAPSQGDEVRWESGMPWSFYKSVIYVPDETGESLVGTLHVDVKMARDLEFIIGVFSRELCQSLLLMRPDLEFEQSEYQSTVELMPIFYGLGIFAANAVFRETNENHLGWNYWSLVPWTNLPARLIGHALALVSWLREEPLPRWSSLLRRDAESAMRGALKYLQKTSDAILDQESPEKNYAKARQNEWLEDLKNGTSGRRVAALWAIQDQASGIQAAEAVPIIAENLTHRDPVVRAAAAAALDALGEKAASAVPELIIALDDRNGSVRKVAALALGRMTSRSEEILTDLLPVLRDRNIHVANAAAWSVGQFGHQAEDAGPALVRLLRRGIVHCEESTLEDILDAVLSVTKHPEEVIMETLLERDSETCQRALDLLKERQIDAVAEPS